jgi:acyl carrier protein
MGADHRQTSDLDALWKRVLHVDEVRPDDDFFGSGGHSLQAVRLVELLSTECGIEISMSDIFENSTFSGLCDLVGRIA